MRGRPSSQGHPLDPIDESRYVEVYLESQRCVGHLQVCGDLTLVDWVDFLGGLRLYDDLFFDQEIDP